MMAGCVTRQDSHQLIVAKSHAGNEWDSQPVEGGYRPAMTASRKQIRECSDNRPLLILLHYQQHTYGVAHLAQQCSAAVNRARRALEL
jgi:hypothetical protein